MRSGRNAKLSWESNKTMAELTKAERVMRVLRREEPDRVPHFEWLISKVVRDALVPGCTGHNDFAIKMGHDALLVAPDFTKEQIGPTEYMTEWGYSKDYGHEEHGIEVQCPIQTMDDFNAWEPPDPHAPGRYDTIEKTVAEWKGKMAIGVHLNDVFSIPRSLMSMTSILMAVMADPALVSALVRIVHGLDHPGAPGGVEGEVNRFALQQWLAGEGARLEAWSHSEPVERQPGGERSLHAPASLGAPTRHVVRYTRVGIDVLERCGGRPRARVRIPCRPADAARQEIHETRIRPGAQVMP